MLGNPLCKQIPWSNDDENLLAWKQVCITVLNCYVSYYPVLYCHVLFCTDLYCTFLYCSALYCTFLCCTVMYCSVLCMMYIVTGQVKQYPMMHYFGRSGQILSVNVKWWLCSNPVNSGCKFHCLIVAVLPYCTLNTEWVCHLHFIIYSNRPTDVGTSVRMLLFEVTKSVSYHKCLFKFKYRLLRYS